MQLLSIIIPYFNIEKELIERLLDSLYLNKELVPTIEITLIDDGSSPAFTEILPNYSTRYPSLQLIRQENVGLGGARNRGIDTPLSGKYTLFVDADDYLFAANIRSMLQLCRESNAEIIELGMIPVKKIKPIYSPLIPLQTEQLTLAAYGTHRTWTSGIWRYLIRTDFLKTSNVRFHPTLWHEDELFIVQLFTQAQQIVTTNLPLYAYYQRKGSITYTHNQPQERRRGHDLLQILDLILETKKNISYDHPARQAIDRKIAFLTLDTIRITARSRLNQTEKQAFIKQLRIRKLLPLPNNHYGTKYFLFRLLTNIPPFLDLFLRIA